MGDGQTLRHPIFISDMVVGFDLASKYEGEPGEIFIIAGPEPVSLEQLASGIADTLGVKSPTLRFPKALVWSGVVGLETIAKITGMKAPFTRRSMKFYTGNTAFSIHKAQSQLNFQPQIGLGEGLRLTANWLSENNRI